jgi:chromosome segregation ATPase
MISLEQVRTLEDRVERAVAYIASLREEAAELKRRLAEASSFIDEAASEIAASEEKTLAAEKRAEAAEALLQAESGRIREIESRLADMAGQVAAAETRSAELNARAEEYRRDQVKIEEGIVHALEKLDSFEDLVLSQGSPAQTAPEPEPAPPEASSSEAEPAGKSEEPSEDESLLGYGVAVKAAPEARGSESKGEAAPNELDIF